MPTRRVARSRFSLRATLAILTAFTLAGCPDDPPSLPSDLGAPSGEDLGCYLAPTTHLELLNACTSAQSLTKQPVLPLLRPDGTLPPLP